MRRVINQFTAIAALTLLEAVRQPVTLLLTALTVLFTASIPLMVLYDLGDAQRLVRDSGLALHLVGGLALGGFAACSTLSREFRKGTASAVLSKPIHKASFFLAKFAGVAALVVFFSAVMASATMLATSMVGASYDTHALPGVALFGAVILALTVAGLQNYFTGTIVASRAFLLLVLLVPAAAVGIGLTGPAEVHLPLEILPASVLVTLAILVLSALAVSLATRLAVVPVLVVCSTILMVGLMSDYLFGRHAATSGVSALLYGLLPNWQHFWAVDALNAGGVPWSYVVSAASYAAFYLAGILTLGIVAFHRMEVR